MTPDPKERERRRAVVVGLMRDCEERIAAATPVAEARPYEWDDAADANNARAELACLNLAKAQGDRDDENAYLSISAMLACASEIRKLRMP
jgi:hypothetical protein